MESLFMLLVYFLVGMVAAHRKLFKIRLTP